MNRCGFEKVSYEQFKEGFAKAFEVDDEDLSVYEDVIRMSYESIKMPKRATAKSAGHDFYSPFGYDLRPGETIMIPTGIRCYMPDNMVLMMFPRSGLGSKFRYVPCNLTGIIDADYYNADNEGHIFMKMANDGDDVVEINVGQAFCQGILLNYGITDDDDVDAERHGGFGSTEE